MTEDLQDLAGEYVLGTLGAAQRREVEQRLPRDAALRAAVEDWEARLLPLTSLAEPVDLPPQLWGGIEQRLAPMAPAAASRPRATPAPRWHGWWNSLALWRGLAAAGFAAALTLVVLPNAPPGGAPPQYVVVLVAPGGQAPGWVVQARSPRNLELVPLQKTEVPQSKALQFWTKADNWSGPVSLGLVRPGETVRVPLDQLPPLQPNQLFEITLEPAQGSPTGRPTGPIQYIGRAVKLQS